LYLCLFVAVDLVTKSGCCYVLSCVKTCVVSTVWQEIPQSFDPHLQPFSICNAFWATVCKTFRPMVSVRCLSCLSGLSVTFVHCGQTVGQIKMKLGMRVGLGPGHIVFGGNPALPPLKGHSPPPIFGPYLLRPNGCMDQDVTWYGARPRFRRLCVRWGPRSPLPKRGPPNFRPMFIAAKRLDG